MSIASRTACCRGRGSAAAVPFSLRRERGSVAVSGTLTFYRLDFGIGTGEWSNTKWLGGEVKVDFRAMPGGK